MRLSVLCSRLSKEVSHKEVSPQLPAAQFHLSDAALGARARTDVDGSSGRVLDEWPTYPANLCPLFWWVEFADFREDLGHSIGEPVEIASGRAFGQGSTEHLDCVLSEEQRVNNAVYASAWREDRCLRLWDEMARLGAGQTKLALQIIPGNLDVPHRHPRILVTE